MKLRKLSGGLKASAAVGIATVLLAMGHETYFDRLYSPISNAQAASAEIDATPQSGRKTVPGLYDFSEIVAQQGPAVVNITVSTRIKSNVSGFSQINPTDPVYEFFKRFKIPVPQAEIPAHEMGSGFIISPDGVILTNAHVVENADEVIVRLIDKREFKAKILGADKLSDVAVLKIDAQNLRTVKIGDSRQTRVGEWVIAIGSPYGLENSVSAGIISAKSRSLAKEGNVPFLQTDAAVNPGNSGGPLFNMNGEVIGINSQIYSHSGGYQGLSFAIPIDVAMNIERQLREHGKVSRGRLGIAIQDLSQQLADSFGLDKPAGALVSSVEKGSAAEKAGIDVGDIILKFNGTDIVHSTELPALVADVAPGTPVKIEVWHAGKQKVVPVVVGEMKTAGIKENTGKHGGNKLGLAVRALTAEERRRIEMPGGILIESVSDEGPAARAGLRNGDVILSINGERLVSVEQFYSMVAKNGKRMAWLILREDQKMFVPISVDSVHRE
jgi:serine protease Do